MVDIRKERGKLQLSYNYDRYKKLTYEMQVLVQISNGNEVIDALFE